MTWVLLIAQIISAVLDADELVSISWDRADLERRLQIMDAMRKILSTCVDTSTIELMADDPASLKSLCPGATVSSGLAEYVSSWRCLTGMIGTVCDYR